LKKKILYIDDEPINVELFRLNFEKEYEVFTGLSAYEGLGILENEDIKVIVSDLKMPVMNGMEFIEEIKRKSPEKICLILTAYTEPDIIIKGLNEETVFRYMVKPWKKTDLKKAVEEAFERYENSIKK
jgi:response regulator RpfG family c-di-GMP phosphodiesterase